MNEHIPNLKIEANDDGTITLEQEWTGNVDRVAIHPCQLRLIAERLGMVQAVTASGAELGRDNDRLKRHLLRVREHALTLQREFSEHADWAHADMSHEMARINTLVDLLDMAADDFEDDYQASEPASAKPSPKPSAKTSDRAAPAPEKPQYQMEIIG